MDGRLSRGDPGSSRHAPRQQLLDAASRLLAEEGPAAVTVRRVAGEVGTSTMAIYTAFGGKEGLLLELWREGFERLWEQAEAVGESNDPLADLFQLGRTYRRYALGHPHYYTAIFGRARSDFSPAPADLERSRQALLPLVRCVRRCVDAGDLAPGDPEEVVMYLWAVAHGAVSLELAGYAAEAADPDQRFEATLRWAVAGVQGPPRRQRGDRGKRRSSP